MQREKLDEIIGVTRCAKCGHRLEGEIECPFCAAVSGVKGKRPSGHLLPGWAYLAACFLTSPFSLVVILRTGRLNAREKILACSGCLLWPALYSLLI
jgi:hypothetical protein